MMARHNRYTFDRRDPFVWTRIDIVPYAQISFFAVLLFSTAVVFVQKYCVLENMCTRLLLDTTSHQDISLISRASPPNYSLSYHGWGRYSSVKLSIKSMMTGQARIPVTIIWANGCYFVTIFDLPRSPMQARKHNGSWSIRP